MDKGKIVRGIEVLVSAALILIISYARGLM